MQNVHISAQVRHSDGRVEPFRIGLLDGLDDEDRIELSILNAADKTFYVHLIAIDDEDEIDGIGRMLSLSGGDRKTTSIAARDLPGNLGRLACIGADNSKTIAAALEHTLGTEQLSKAGVRLMALAPDGVEITPSKRRGPGMIEGPHKKKGGRFRRGSVEARSAAPPELETAAGDEPSPRLRPSSTYVPEAEAEMAPGAVDADGAVAANGGDEPPTVDGGGGEQPTRTVYGRLDADETVTVGSEFVVTAGIRPDPQPGIEGDTLMIPEGELTLEIQLLAFGFELRVGENWRRELRVEEVDQWPVTHWHLTASSLGNASQVRSLEVKYARDGQVLGFAKRSIGVAPTDADASALTVPQPEPHQFTPPTEADKADLTITISHPDHAGPDVFLVSLDSPHEIEAPDRAPQISVGLEAREFARRLIEDIEQREGFEELEEELKGAGRTIAEKLPRDVWRAAASVGKAAQSEGRAPTVLLLTAEPHVPWELAYMKDPLDPARPSFLGAQAVVGRWPIVSTEPPPEKRPRPATLVETFTVVSGRYEGRWRDLEHARAEAEELSQKFQAEKVDASMSAIRKLFKRKPSPTLLHFAMHGKADETGYEEGLITIEDRSVTPNFIIGSDLNGEPFVFLNACQVGRGAKQLGNYAGLATAFLEKGASGVVAPLWKIDDKVAAAIAVRFYKRVLTNSEHPAAVLRDERAEWLDKPTSSTFLAYQFWGHPSLQMQREGT